MLRFCMGTMATVFLAQHSFADPIAHLNWCRTHFGSPTATGALLASTPDGGFRGSLSAVNCYAKARNEAMEGHDDKAIEWATLCQWHDPAAQADIRENRATVLQFLRDNR